NQAAHQASQQAKSAHQHAQQIIQQRRAELYQQVRQQLGEQLASLHTLERQARNTGMFDFKGIKAKARQQREALDAEYAQALARGKPRMPPPHGTEAARWLDHVASSIINTTLPAVPDLLDAQQQAHLAFEDAQHGTE